MTCSRDGIRHRESCLKCGRRGSIAWHTGASPADDIGRPISDNEQKAREISQATDSSPIRLLPGSLAWCLRYTFPRTRNEDELSYPVGHGFRADKPTYACRHGRAQLCP